jgi:hypothetical protein
MMRSTILLILAVDFALCDARGDGSRGRFLPAKLTSRFLLPIAISSRQIDGSISIADFFPPN